MTASGTTLLGSDDKSGVAVIMTLVERFLPETKRKHGLIRVCFTPDEEIGHGVDKLDLRMLGANVAYTLDGGRARGDLLGNIFWRCGGSHHRGVTTHTMEAGQRHGERGLSGRKTTGSAAARTLRAGDNRRAGRIHSPIHVEGRTERTVVKFLLRDFELKGLADKGKILRGLCRGLQASEPRARVRCKLRKQYRNMAYWLRKDMRPVELAREAFVVAGLKPYDHVIRGGTDGSRLTELGLPTPNLFCGEHNAHGPLEWVAVQDMESAVTACAHLAECGKEKAELNSNVPESPAREWSRGDASHVDGQAERPNERERMSQCFQSSFNEGGTLTQPSTVTSILSSPIMSPDPVAAYTSRGRRPACAAILPCGRSQYNSTPLPSGSRK